MNSMIKSIIVDDEPNSRETLEKLLEIEGSVKVLSKCQNINEAYTATIRIQPDIIFLDIEMPDGTGFELIDKLKPLGIKTEIIFITAYNHYAIDAIKHAAFDYILKPVDIDDLSQCIKRYKETVTSDGFEIKAENLSKQIKDIGKIQFNIKGGVIFIDPQDIIWCQASGSYTIIHLKREKNELVSIPLGDVENLLERNSFFRVSRSALINLKYLVKIDRRRRCCHIESDGVKAEVAISSSQIRFLD